MIFNLAWKNMIIAKLLITTGPDCYQHTKVYLDDINGIQIHVSWSVSKVKLPEFAHFIVPKGIVF